jgi:hypothetical protein
LASESGYALELLGTCEVAETLGIEKSRVPRWRNQGVLPEPVADLAAGPIWIRAQIEAVRGERERRRRRKYRRRSDAQVT